MLHSNNTPYAAIGFEQWHRDGSTMACIAVRAEMVFGEDGQIHFSDQQEIILADKFEGDPQKTPLVTPGDLVPFKPGTDITFLGSIHSGDQSEKQVLEASLKIGNHTRSIRASGPREWIADGDSWHLSDLERISELPLCYTKASGGRLIGDPSGRVDPRNPIGPNLIDVQFSPRGRNYPAAQIDSEQEPINSDFLHPPFPQGFGPMAPWWQNRQRYTGTYDDEWKENIHPRLPRDFDYRFYNCAHPSLVLDGFVAGGDVVELTNLTPSGRFLFRLPNSTPFARFQFVDGREVLATLNLDGIHIDFREHPYRYALTWRAWLDICPAFYRIDLECETLDKVRDMCLPVACEAGLRENTAGAFGSGEHSNQYTST